MAKLLITGATGYIGGRLADYYRQLGADLRLLVRQKPEPKNSEFLGEIIQADLTQTASLKAAVKGIEAVIHCAGMLGKWGTPYQCLRDVNAQGVQNLILAAFEAGAKRFIHLSAAGVTGPLASGSVDETYPSQPRTDYERSKWEGEKLALQLAEERNLNILVLRPTFTYGPADPHKLPLFRAVKNNRIAFIGDGLSTIHPVFIDDLLSGIDLALKSDLKNQTLIIGGARPVTKRDLIWGIADVLGCRRPTLKFPVWAGEGSAWLCEQAAGLFGFEPPLTQSRVLMMSRNWGYSIARAQNLLGYQPKVGLAEGLRRTAQWYQEHRWL